MVMPKGKDYRRAFDCPPYATWAIAVSCAGIEAYVLFFFYIGLVGIMRACSCFFLCVWVCVFCRIVFFISTVKVVQEMDPPPQPPSSKDSSTDSSRGSFQVDNTMIGSHLQAFAASRA